MEEDQRDVVRAVSALDPIWLAFYARGFVANHCQCKRSNLSGRGRCGVRLDLTIDQFARQMPKDVYDY